MLLDELADAARAGTRRERMANLAAVPFLIIDDLAMRKLPATAAEDLLELIQRRYERVRTLLDRLLHHAHVLRCGPRSWRMSAGPTGTRADKIAHPVPPC